MANLEEFNANNVVPYHNFDPIPAGKYVAAITVSEMKHTPSTHEPYLQLEFTVLDGDYKGRKVFDRLFINHPSERVQKIERGRLSAICRAIGVMQPKDSKDLHNLELIINVKLKKSSDNGEPTNKIIGFEAKLDDDTDAGADAEDLTKENAQLKFEKAQLKFEKAQLQVENERLRAIVDKLPKTADGVAVSDWHIVYRGDGTELVVLTMACEEVCVDRETDQWECNPVLTSIRNCYSTREAAEAAKEDK
jgi:hypothetical protein